MSLLRAPLIAWMAERRRVRRHLNQHRVFCKRCQANVRPQMSGKCLTNISSLIVFIDVVYYSSLLSSMLTKFCLATTKLESGDYYLTIILHEHVLQEVLLMQILSTISPPVGWEGDGPPPTSTPWVEPPFLPDPYKIASCYAGLLVYTSLLS